MAARHEMASHGDDRGGTVAVAVVLAVIGALVVSAIVVAVQLVGA